MIVKVCGITSAEDARAAIELGADWIGLNLVGGPRRIELNAARLIIDVLDHSAPIVALISVDSGEAFNDELAALRDKGVTRFQLYGSVDLRHLETVHRWGGEVLYVRRVGCVADARAISEGLTKCASHAPEYLIIDAADRSLLGGTGKLADWGAVAETKRRGDAVGWPPLILAGGLNSENVRSAIHEVAPDGVDVSSGVESAPGRKDPARISAFIAAVRGAGQ